MKQVNDAVFAKVVVVNRRKQHLALTKAAGAQTENRPWRKGSEFTLCPAKPPLLPPYYCGLMPTSAFGALQPSDANIRGRSLRFVPRSVVRDTYVPYLACSEGPPSRRKPTLDVVLTNFRCRCQPQPSTTSRELPTSAAFTKVYSADGNAVQQYHLNVSIPHGIISNIFHAQMDCQPHVP